MREVVPSDCLRSRPRNVEGRNPFLPSNHIFSPKMGVSGVGQAPEALVLGLKFVLNTSEESTINKLSPFEDQYPHDRSRQYHQSCILQILRQINNHNIII